MPEKRHWIAGCACFCAVLIPSVIMFACSFASLGQTQMGLDYSSVSKSVNSQVYRSGLYFLGLGHSFIVFPTTLQSVDFAGPTLLKTRTSDGLPLTLGCSFQFRYQALTIYELYRRYGGGQDTVIANVAKDLLSTAATNYTAYTFFNDKQGIATDMLQLMERFFEEHMLITIDALQLTTTQLPQSFEEAIQRTINVQQNVSQVQKRQQTVAVQLSTDVVVARKKMSATISLAKGQASQIRQAAAAQAEALGHTLRVEAIAYKFIDDELGITPANKSQLIEYIYWDALADQAAPAASAQFLVGLQPETYVAGSP